MEKPAQWSKHVHAALSGWYKQTELPHSPLDDLQMVVQQLPKQASSAEWQQQTNQIVADSLAILAQRNELLAAVLQQRFLENRTIKAVGLALDLSDDQVNRRQREAVDELADIIWEQELAFCHKWAIRLRDKLPIANYTELFGCERQKAQVVASLLDEDASGVVAISGMGGLGKTSLAHAAVLDIIDQHHFQEVVWIYVDPATISGRSATAQLLLDLLSLDLIRQLVPDLTHPPLRAERLQMLRQLLRQKPYLVVIDNIETEIDTAVLMQHLHDWAHPSKFLVTTRTQLRGQTATLSVPLSELAKVDAQALIAHQAEQTGQLELAADVAQVIDDIYAVTGGNPLALKLVVSLISYMPLDHVLLRVQGGNEDTVQRMYNRIYRQAWTTLNEDARELLLAMPLVGEAGSDVGHLQAISELDEGRIWAAIADLVGRSLIEVRGSYKARRYAVHRLTMTFLKTEIIEFDWGDV